MAACARQAKDSELIQYATEIKVRAERRCGELLASTERAPAGRPSANTSNRTTDSPPTLAEMGLTRDESSRYQQLAAMPAEHFETAVATAKATAGEVTTAADPVPRLLCDFCAETGRQVRSALGRPSSRFANNG